MDYQESQENQDHKEDQVPQVLMENPEQWENKDL